jgi:HD-GYP domain-containing protein (c-di-GMP phosphodiesterase class II)
MSQTRPMHKTIRVDQLRLGMHLHSLGGAWLEHPFWKTSFVLQDPTDLRKLRDSGIKECVIDAARGLDVEPEPAVPLPSAAPPHAVPAAPARPAPQRTRLEEEAAIAARLCAQARHSVSALFEEARMGRALDVEGCAPLVDEIASSMRRNAGAMLGLVRLKTHDDYTFMHSVAVCTLMVVLSRRIGLDEAQVREAGLAGLLHDMGKARIPLEVLNKPGKLTPAEYNLIKGHPRLGHDMLLDSGMASPTALDVCLHHHERPDGQGYPEGLSGEAFSRLARMGAVCDVYDAITSNRPYKEGWLPADSIAKMAEWTRAGKFDAAVFRAFIDCVGIYPVGSLVRLGSQRLAVVVEHNPEAPLTPRIKVFYSLRSQLTLPTEMLDLSQSGCRDRIVGRESNAKWRFPFLDTLAAPLADAAPARPSSKETA